MRKSRFTVEQMIQILRGRSGRLGAGNRSPARDFGEDLLRLSHLKTTIPYGR